MAPVGCYGQAGMTRVPGFNSLVAANPDLVALGGEYALFGLPTDAQLERDNLQLFFLDLLYYAGQELILEPIRHGQETIDAAREGDFRRAAWFGAGFACEVGKLCDGLKTVAQGAVSWAKRMVRRGDDVADAARAIDSNKLNHIFGKAGHNLDDVVSAVGSREAAFEAMERGAQSALNAGRLAPDSRGVFETVVNIGGADVTVAGRVVDGVARVGSAWR